MDSKLSQLATCLGFCLLANQSLGAIPPKKSEDLRQDLYKQARREMGLSLREVYSAVIDDQTKDQIKLLGLLRKLDSNPAWTDFEKRTQENEQDCAKAESMSKCVSSRSVLKEEERIFRNLHAEYLQHKSHLSNKNLFLAVAVHNFILRTKFLPKAQQDLDTVCAEDSEKCQREKERLEKFTKLSKDLAYHSFNRTTGAEIDNATAKALLEEISKYENN